MNAGLTKRLLGGRTDFERSFRSGEHAAIIRRNGGRTRLLLTLLIGLTLAALAFAVGSLEELGERMDNPFTNIVDKGIYLGDRPAFERIRRDLHRSGRGRAMGLDTITDWSVYILNVFPAGTPLVTNANPTRSLRGRTVDFRSSLFNFLFVPANVRAGLDFRGPDAATDYERQGGIVIKARVLEELGYASNDLAAVRRLPVYDNSLGGVYFLPVLAIVTDLPNNADFVSSKDFYLSLYGDNCQRESFITNREGDNNLRFVVPAPGLDAFREKALQLLQPEAEAEIDHEELVAGGRQLRVVTLSLRIPYVRARPGFYARFQAALLADRTDWLPYARYQRTVRVCSKDGAQQAAFVFSDLSRIREFRAYLLNESGIDLPIDVVENKENFAMVSQLGFSISVVLLLAALAGIAFFLRNLIEGHFHEVKANLGTFRAFGLSSSQLIRQYRRIVSVLLAEATTLGVSLAILIGALLYLLDIQRYSIFNGWFIGAILSIFVFSRWFSGRLIRRLLTHPPGDLVYGRV